MDRKFWIECWEQRKIAFHQKDGHPKLSFYYPTHFKYPPSSNVLIPLCGKTHDLIYFKKQNLNATGIELSPIAAKEFFADNGLSYQTSKSNDFIIYKSDSIQIHQGDFFNFNCNKSFSLIYDRAALIALPSSMRTQYAQKLIKILSLDLNSKLFLISISYIPEKSHDDLFLGPPFSVKETEIKELFKECSKISILEKCTYKATSQRLIDAGVENVEEMIWSISK